MSDRPAGESSKRSTTCPVCGGREFTWGYLQGQGLNFKPDDASLVSRLFGFGYRMRARVCRSCENLQLFVN